MLLAVWAIAEIALQVYDTYETAQTVLDPCASLAEKGTILGLYVFGLALPGGGYSTAGATGIRSVKRLDQADDLRQTFKLVDRADDTRAATRIGDDVDEIDTIKVTKERIIFRIGQEGGIANRIIQGFVSADDFLRHRRSLAQHKVKIEFDAAHNLFDPNTNKIYLAHSKDAIPRGVFFEEMQHALDWHQGHQWSLPHPSTPQYVEENIRIHIGTFERMAANRKRFGLTDAEVDGLLQQVTEWRQQYP